MSRPWMPLYCAEYIGHTTHLSAAESGAYLHLIMHYWVHEGLPTQDGPLARIAKMSPAEWKRAKPIIKPFFEDDWKHDRVERELKEAAEAYERRASAGKAGGIATSNARSNAPAGKRAKRQQSPSQSERSLRDLDAGDDILGRFRAAYPRDDEPDGVRRELGIRLDEGVSIDEIVAGAKRYAAEVVGREKRFIKSPTMWLRLGCWKDGAKTPKPGEAVVLGRQPNGKWLLLVDSPQGQAHSEAYQRKHRTMSCPWSNREKWYFPSEWPETQPDTVSNGAAA